MCRARRYILHQNARDASSSAFSPPSDSREVAERVVYTQIPDAGANDTPRVPRPSIWHLPWSALC